MDPILSGLVVVMIILALAKALIKKSNQLLYTREGVMTSVVTASLV